MEKNDWVLKPEYGTSLFFLFSSFLWVMRFITCMNVSKKKKKKENHVLNSLIHIAPSHAFYVSHVIDTPC